MVSLPTASSIFCVYLLTWFVCVAGGNTCSSTKFACNNSVGCIPQDWFCDFDNDCQDMADEPSTCCEYLLQNSIIDIDN